MSLGALGNEIEAEANARELLAQKQWFLAYDAARTALAQWPGNLHLRHVAARALINLGAPEEAEKTLEPVCATADLEHPEILALFNTVRASTAGMLSGADGGPPSPEALAAFAQMVDALSRHRTHARDASDEETLGLLGRVHKAKWQESGSIEDARRCRDVYLRAFQVTGGHWTCVNAMTMSWIIGQMHEKRGEHDAAKAEHDVARQLAKPALLACERELAKTDNFDRVWALASRAEAWLHLGDEAEAIRAFEEFAKHTRADPSMVVPPARQMRLLQAHGFPVPARVLEILKPPTVIAFTGHMIDKPGRETPRFTPEMEPSVRKRIEEALDKLDAKVGFGSAACGADLLFIEALLDRDAEVHIVIPFAQEDFLRESVRFAGAQWERRFKRALKLVGDSVTFATQEPYLQTTRLFGFADQMVRSLAFLHARAMATLPTLVALYDGSPPTGDVGTADMIAGWPDKERVFVIELPKANLATPAPLANEARHSESAADNAIGGVGASPHGRRGDRLEPLAPESVGEAPTPHRLQTRSKDEISQTPSPIRNPLPAGMTRGIRTLLFADVVNFSRLSEEKISFFMFSFLNEAASRLLPFQGSERSVETWGDGIFVVMNDALPLARYAMSLRDIDFATLGLPREMSVRIGLHAGPVFEGLNAMTGRKSFYGSHVNRAARIEPITLPGHIYASQSFVALLTDEQQHLPSDQQPFVSEFLGNIALAKNFGNMNVYRVRQKRRRG